MSIQAAIGRIDQILQLQQQVADPSLATTAPATTTSTTAALTPSADTSSLAAALASAQSATATAATNPLTAGLSTVAGAGSASDARVHAMISEADSLLGKPHVYGGGHSGWVRSRGMTVRASSRRCCTPGDICHLPSTPPRYRVSQEWSRAPAST